MELHLLVHLLPVVPSIEVQGAEVYQDDCHYGYCDIYGLDRYSFASMTFHLRLAVKLSDLIENAVSFAQLRLVLESSTYGSEQVVAIQSASVGNVVDSDTWMNECSLSFCQLGVLCKDFVIYYFSISPGHE